MGDDTPVVVADRRGAPDRRQQTIPVAVERRVQNRRRRIDPTTCERDYSTEQVEFLRAMERFRRISAFPTCREVLQVVYSMGYRRVAEPTALPGVVPSASAAVEEHNPDRDLTANSPAQAERAGG